MKSDYLAKNLHINGIVQGVGFRPFVYQLAIFYGLKGEVANTSSGLSIHIEGPEQSLHVFCRDLIAKHPPLAQITDIADRPAPVKGFRNFTISQSRTQISKSTLISPDISICEDCLRELFDTENRRYHYPFINCTNCGPRYTIIDDIPYDRPNTSMKHFPMCRQCRAEYEAPADRRFHAQPNACPDCGPQVSLHDNAGNLISALNAIKETAKLLQQGCIVAIKGLGGFHMAVDAANHNAVIRLRKRKHREEKPLAVMAFDLQRIQRFAQVTAEEKKLLTSPHRPIVLLKKIEPNILSGAVSINNPYIGTMLPYTPLHYLLLDHDFTALVMTSGNMSEEPIAIDNQEAFERLSNITDYFLVHNRDIYLRSDDSVAKITAGAPRLIRRSRGYVPRPVFLKRAIPRILACGAELKNTICLAKDNRAFMSQHIGDLENLETYEFFKMTVKHLERILDIAPEVIAYDLHPDYLSTRFALEQTEIPKIPVQHHHAHIISCMAENQVDGPIIGLSFDGTGYGTDGKIWGGEILIAEPHQFMRIAHLSYVPMPGSAAAIKEPWRMALSYLYDAFGEELPDLSLPFIKQLDKIRLRFVLDMIRKKVNSPLTSSLGRLFDAIAAIVGVKNHVAFEGQAAMELEMLAHRNMKQTKTIAVYDYDWTAEETIKILPSPIVRGVVRDVEKGIAPSEISRKFHNTLIRLFAELCETIRYRSGLQQVALSGGVFQNSLLLTGLTRALEEKKFQVLSHTQVPCNDGGIALGQAVAAGTMVGK
jgi:hydrogenase maturation protein HypF